MLFVRGICSIPGYFSVLVHAASLLIGDGVVTL